MPDPITSPAATDATVARSVESTPAGVKVGWGVAGILATAQFIMVLDTTVMNVSITQVVSDLNTTVVGLQTAITMYTLVMAAFMLIGGKIGDRWGAKRAFWIGGLVYGAGSLTTALSPNLAVLLVGWSLVEGLGAVLVIPAIAALTAATYQGKQRAMAYGILGGVSGASMASTLGSLEASLGGGHDWAVVCLDIQVPRTRRAGRHRVLRAVSPAL